MIARIVFSFVIALILGAPAVKESNAQTTLIERPRPMARQEGAVRVQMSIQLFLAGPTDESEEADKQRERARRALYSLASKECDVLRDTIAQDCQLQSVNVNLNRQANMQMQGYSVNGSMAFQITLK